MNIYSHFPNSNKKFQHSFKSPFILSENFIPFSSQADTLQNFRNYSENHELKRILSIVGMNWNQR